MRNVIITVGLVLICAALLVGQGDINEMQREGHKVKYIADDMANAASISIDPEPYSRGYIVFDYTEGNHLASEVLQKSGGYDSTYKSIGDYFASDAVIDIYYFDQSLTCKHYRNGVHAGTMDFTFDGRKISEWVPELKDIETPLKYPCTCVIYNAGKPRINIATIASLVKVQKMAVYEYKY